MKRVAALVSGRGSNLQALIDAERRAALGPAALALVVADRPCGALQRAADAGIPGELLRLRDFATRQDWDRALLERLRSAEIEIVVCAGFNRVLGPSVLAAYPRAILNVHPALLPAFPGGLHAQADAIAHGVKVSGCTVHFVTDEVDAGPIVLQRAVEVRDDDDEEVLAMRILAEEHRALPEAVRLLAEDRLRIEGRRVRVLGARLCIIAPESRSPVVGQPRLSNMVLLPDEVDAARGVLRRLVDESGADGALLLLRSGEIAVAESGPEVVQVETLGALLAGNFAAAREIARLLGESGFESQFQQGTSRQVVTQAVGDGWLLSVLFGPASALGMVKLLSARAAIELVPLNRAAQARVARGEVPSGPGSAFRQAASGAIDALFGERG